MSAQELFREGRLGAALERLAAQLRDDPANTKNRTFLFELLCFAGEFDRAEKQLALLGEGNQKLEIGALLYRAALQAERTRGEMFDKGEFPASGVVSPPVSGSLNGQRFAALADADPRIGARVEVFAAGNYLWLPFAHIESIRIEPPKRLRDLVWTPAILRTGKDCRSLDLGEVLLPALAPLSWRHSDDLVRLGRMTVWEPVEDGEIPCGQKILLVDGEEIPFLEIRSLTIDQPETETDAAA